MSLPPYSAADIAVLRQTDPGRPRPVMRPNPITLAATAWTPVSIQTPSRIVPLTAPSGALYARPFDRGDSTSAATLQKTSYTSGPAIELWAPGLWYVYNAGTAVNAVVLDATGAANEGLTWGYTSAAHTQVNLNTATATTLLAANPGRRFCTIQNNSDGWARVRWDGTNPTTTTGLRLSPHTLWVFEGAELHRRGIVGIEESAALAIEVVEGV